MLAIISATSLASLVLSGLTTLYLEAALNPARMYLYSFPYRVSEGMYSNQTDASHLESLLHIEVYQCILELVNALARLLVSITIA